MHVFKYLLLYIFLISLLQVSCKKENINQESADVLHAERGNRKGIFDQQGRFIILRGVNYNCLGDYWIANPQIPPVKTYEANDFKMISECGFNCIRLLFHWSKLEPERGKYNQDYINEIKSAIENAAKYNIYILLDMHQDAWGKYIATPPSETCTYPNNGWDGAPEWATITDGASTCKNDGSGVGGRETAPAVYHSFQNFYENKNDIQSACIKAWAALVKQTAIYSNIVGYDLLNEPNLGYKSILEESKKLGAFYNNTITAIRSAERSSGAKEHIIFFEMSVVWNGQGIPFIPPLDFTLDKNIIFAPHTYFEAITYLLTIEQGYDLLSNLSNLYQTGTFIGEYGYFDDDINNAAAKLKRFAIKEDNNFGSSTYWHWVSTPGDPHAISWDGTHYENTSMALIETDFNGKLTGRKNDDMLNILSRSYPRAIHGRPLKLRSNPDNGIMYLEATATTTGSTILWINNKFGQPHFNLKNSILQEIKPTNGGFLATFTAHDNYSIEVTY